MPRRRRHWTALSTHLLLKTFSGLCVVHYCCLLFLFVFMILFPVFSKQERMCCIINTKTGTKRSSNLINNGSRLYKKNRALSTTRIVYTKRRGEIIYIYFFFCGEYEGTYIASEKLSLAYYIILY